MSKKPFKIVLLVLLLLAGIFTIQFLKRLTSGGELNTESTFSDKYVLIGREFNGSANDQDFIDIFEKVEVKKANDSLPTYMIHYEMDEPSKSNQFYVNTFIGYLVNDTLGQITADYEYRILHKRKVVRATSSSNLIFQGKVYPALKKYMTENNLKVDSSYIIEKYWKDNKIEIEMGIQ